MLNITVVSKMWNKISFKQTKFEGTEKKKDHNLTCRN